MFVLNENAEKMAELLHRIIGKGEVHSGDYAALLAEADRDGRLDIREQAILKALAELIDHKLIRRVSRCSECRLPDKSNE